jgi:hypothetical protein
LRKAKGVYFAQYLRGDVRHSALSIMQIFYVSKGCPLALCGKRLRAAYLACTATPAAPCIKTKLFARLNYIPEYVAMPLACVHAASFLRETTHEQLATYPLPGDS